MDLRCTKCVTSTPNVVRLACPGTWESTNLQLKFRDGDTRTSLAHDPGLERRALASFRRSAEDGQDRG